MSESFEFCLNRASDPNVSPYTDRDWTKTAEIVDTQERFDAIIKGSRRFSICRPDSSGKKVNLNMEVCFDENADFDYFTSETCVHDGTLYFVLECVDRCINKVLCATTYDTRLRRKIINGCTIKYTVGNFVVSNEHGNFGSEAKPWLNSRTTVLLPLKQEVVA